MERKKPDLAKSGNIRDYTDLLHLIILSNIEKNADLIANGISQKERLIILNQSAKDQVELLKNNKNIKELENLQNDINNKVLINKKEKE
jgi:kilA, N-terminal/APSES-type HTH DNA-binding domain protein